MQRTCHHNVEFPRTFSLQNMYNRIEVDLQDINIELLFDFVQTSMQRGLAVVLYDVIHPTSYFYKLLLPCQNTNNVSGTWLVHADIFIHLFICLKPG